MCLLIPQIYIWLFLVLDTLELNWTLYSVSELKIILHTQVKYNIFKKNNLEGD